MSASSGTVKHMKLNTLTLKDSVASRLAVKRLIEVTCIEAKQQGMFFNAEVFVTSEEKSELKILIFARGSSGGRYVTGLLRDLLSRYSAVAVDSWEIISE